MKVTHQNSGGGKYSPLQLAQKYIRYYLTASNGRGHGIHSPFVFDLVKNVLNDSRDFPAYAAIERLRRQLEKDSRVLTIEDMGAGSALPGTPGRKVSPGRKDTLDMKASLDTNITLDMNAGRQRRIADIARRAAKPKKWGQLLFRIARYYRSGTILELGTSLGLSTAYLAAGSGGARVFTIEGAAEVAAVAEKNFRSLGLENIDCTIGNFDDVLEGTLDRAGRIDLAFVDGNHRLEPTLRYFDALYGRLSPASVVVFDDIHWSREMEEAWEAIKADDRVYLTVDLFFIGLVFFRDTFKVKQDFIIRF